MRLSGENLPSSAAVVAAPLALHKSLQPLHEHWCKVTIPRLLILLCIVSVGGTVCAEPAGKQDYLTDCARCHGVDGKGGIPEMRAVPGYMTVDLTQLSANNAGKFPRQEVIDAIDGRKRFPSHFLGDMPAWGLKYQQASPDGEERVRQKISGLVDYVESLQAK
jgi:hypothetical protein